MAKKAKEEQKSVARNKAALRDFHVLESLEAGVELKGAEVKSLREGKANLKGSFARIEKDQMWVYNIHVSPYSHHDAVAPDPLRKRRLLLHQKEIDRLGGKVMEKGCTLIPLSVYFKKGMAKVELGLCKGKRQYDKRKKLREKTIKRDIERSVRDAQKKRGRRSI